jgi:hypothetical protein
VGCVVRFGGSSEGLGGVSDGEREVGYVGAYQVGILSLIESVTSRLDGEEGVGMGRWVWAVSRRSVVTSILEPRKQEKEIS